MKKTLAFITSVLTLLGSGTEVFTANALGSSDWQSAYREAVVEYTRSDEDTSNYMYDLCDLDSDGTPELLISNGDAHSDVLSIFTYKNGKAEYIKDAAGENLNYLGSFGTVNYVRETGLIVIDDTHQGIRDMITFKISDGILKKVNEAQDNSGIVGTDSAECYIGGEKVTYVEFLTFVDNVYEYPIEAIGRKYKMDQLVPLGADALTGDANGDGMLNVRDAAYIAKMLAKGKGRELPLEAEFNGDGSVNVRDAAAIAKLLAYGNG